MDQATTARFVHAARVLGVEARSRRLISPSFRSPPRLLGASRSLRRWEGSVQVAVLVRDRPWPAVLSDMVEGVVAANRLKGTVADELRAGLWRAVSKAQAAETAPANARHLRAVSRAA